MSKKAVKHDIKISRYNRYPGLQANASKRYWWVDCSCGLYNGFDNKRDAEAWGCPRVITQKEPGDG